MPAEGTKKMELDGREVFLPADDVELEQLIKSGNVQQQRVQSEKFVLDAIKARVLEIALRRRPEGKKSVRLTAPTSGEALVTWGTETKVNGEAAQKLKEELPATVFSGIFTEEKIYKPRKGYQGFMKQPQVEELTKLKVKIAAALEFKEKTPSVKFAVAGVSLSVEDCGE